MSRSSKIANRWGGRLDVDNVHSSWSDFIKDAVDRCNASLIIPCAEIKKYSDFDVDFCFTMENSFNAHCAVEDNFGLIAVSAVSIFRILEAAISTVTGGARLIPSDERAINFRRLGFLELLEDEEVYHELRDYNDNYLVRNVVHIALDIMLNHELAHIANGHATWARRAFGMSEIDEVSTVNVAVDALSYQTLEWDADALALQRSLVRALGLQLLPPGQNSGRHATMPPYGPYGAWDQCLYTFGIAIYLLSRFFEDSRDVAGQERFYPPTWYRIQHAFLMVSHTVNTRVIPLHDQHIATRIMDPLMVGATRAEQAWCAATSNQPILSVLFEKRALSDGAVQTNIYSGRWSSLHRLLSNHVLMPSIWDAV